MPSFLGAAEPRCQSKSVSSRVGLPSVDVLGHCPNTSKMSIPNEALQKVRSLIR